MGNPAPYPPSGNNLPGLNSNQMGINMACPHCRAQQSLAPDRAGGIAVCESCGGKFQVPLPTAYVMDSSMSSQYALPPEIQAFAGKKIAAGICGILLGGLGVHKFILGLNTPAIVMLVVWLAGATTGMCLFFPLFASIAMNIIGLVEGIIYLTKSDMDFYQTYAVQRKEWF